MESKEQILSAVKDRVETVLRGAKVFLFGSRAYGVPTEESDWDILILTHQAVTSSIKNNIHSALFPLSVEIAAFINTIIAEEKDWNSNPSYYCLRQDIKGKLISA